MVIMQKNHFQTKV